MSNKTINQLTNLTEISSSDELPIWDNSAGDTKKVSVENLLKKYNTWEDVTSIWVASAKSGFNDNNFNYKVVKKHNIDNTYTYRITALSPYLSESTAYIRFSQLPRTVFGFTAEGSAQTSDGTVICTNTGFANTRNDKGTSNINVNVAFFSDRLELQYSSYASDRSNQCFCTWEITVNKDLDGYFTTT